MITTKTDGYLRDIAQWLKIIADELKKINRRADRAERLPAADDTQEDAACTPTT